MNRVCMHKLTRVYAQVDSSRRVKKMQNSVRNKTKGTYPVVGRGEECPLCAPMVLC